MREIIMGAGALASVGGGAYFSGALDGGEVYNMSAEQVASQLEHMVLPQDLESSMDSMEGTSVHVSRNGTKSVTWTFSLSGLDIAEFKAELTNEGPNKTRVNVNFEIPENGAGEFAKDTPAATLLIKAVAEIAMAEQLDATLEKRKYDSKRVGNTIAAYALTHPAEILAFSGSMAKFTAHADPEQQAELAEALANEPAFQSAFDGVDGSYDSDDSAMPDALTGSELAAAAAAQAAETVSEEE
jgi:hypothetical protein